MKEKIVFEQCLFGNENEIVVNDIEFIVDRVVMLPKIRPHQLDKAVSFSIEYCRNTDFRRKMLEKSNECPVLIYQLFKRGVFVYEEIRPFLKNRNSFLLCYYFWKETDDFGKMIKGKDKPYGFDEFFSDKSGDIGLLIDFGFIPSSIEYCLKYDVVDDLNNFSIMNQNAKWSPFEWSFKPDYLDFLSFSGFFGSIKCFKHLLMKGFEVNEKVLSMVVCSGCSDLFQLCQGQKYVTIESVCMAAEFCHLHMLIYMSENKANINEKNKFVENKFIMRHLFIMLLKGDIFVLLNI